MKTPIIFFSLLLFSFGLTAQSDSITNPNNIRLGVAYTSFGGDQGFTVFNEVQFGVGKRFTVGPNFYFSRTVYNLGGKNVINYLMGIDLNAYFALFKSESASLLIGPGFTFRHRDYSFEYPKYSSSVDPTVGKIESSSKSGAIANFVYERKISSKWNVGIKTTWHPFGPQENLLYAGFYGGLKF